MKTCPSALGCASGFGAASVALLAGLYQRYESEPKYVNRRRKVNRRKMLTFMTALVGSSNSVWSL